MLNVLCVTNEVVDHMDSKQIEALFLLILYSSEL